VIRPRRDRRRIRSGAPLMLATTIRVVGQTVLDVRMFAVLLAMPCVILGLLSWVYSDGRIFTPVGSAMFAMYPILLVTGSAAVVLLRERRSGTLGRLLSLPLRRADLVIGYLCGFLLTSAVQSVVSVGFLIFVAGLECDGPAWQLMIVGAISGALGTSLGLLLGLAARAELEAVQLVPALVAPQFFLAGLLVPRDRLPAVLEQVSEWLPLTHAVQAAWAVVDEASGWSLVSELGASVAYTVGFSVLAGLLLPRRTA
jgi:ABC-2 type transport system permease protein